MSISPLETVFLFQGLSPQQLEEIDHILPPPVDYCKGELIYDQHHFQKSLALVLSGTVHVQTSQEQTSPLILNRLQAGDVFGAAALFDDDSNSYVSEIRAHSAVRLRFISQDLMMTLFTQYPLITQNYIRFLSGRVRFLNRKLSALTAGTSLSRLYHYCMTHQDEDGHIQFPASMTDLARTLNMGRSSLYRSLDYLLDEQMIRRNGKQYYVTK